MSQTPAAPRRYDIDNLRNIAVLLLLVFHTARLFDAERWHIKDAVYTGVADAIVRMMNQWHMPILFLLAGMSLAYALAKRGSLAIARERVTRLFLPLAFGMLVIVPPQVYVERISPQIANRQSPINFQGSYLDFQPHVIECCYPQGNFSWHHLWFVCYLFFYSLLALGVIALLRRGLAQKLSDWLSEGLRPFLLLAPIVVAELLLRPYFRSTHDLTTDWANHAHYFYLLLLGWLIAAHPRLEAAIQALLRPAAFAAIALTFFWLAARDGQITLPRQVMIACRFAGEGCWLFAFLGFAALKWDRPIRYLTAFSRHAYPFCILHQTVIILLGWALLDWAVWWPVKFITVAVASGLISYALCRAADTNPLTRLALGMPAPR